MACVNLNDSLEIEIDNNREGGAWLCSVVE